MVTKTRVMILSILLLFVQVAVNAQTDSYDGRHPIIVDENEVSQVTVSGNFDVVLQKAGKVDLSMKMDKSTSNKVKVKLVNGELFISAATREAAKERMTIFLWANDLETITLRGNSFITSIGVLQIDHLTVNLKDEARIALKASGRINVVTQRDKPVVQEMQYFSVYSAVR